jgi:spermidine/putrescine transport system substrate-binding protein
MPGRRSILAATVLGLAALAAACASGDDPNSGGELHVFNWEDYFAPTTVEDFAAEFGVDVFLDTFDDEQAAASAIQSDPSQYDVVVLSDSLVSEMAGRKLLAELDLSNIPNLSNVDPKFLDQPWDPGNRYSVPYAWGSTGVIYNTKHVEPPARSWSLLRDPSLAGRVALLNDSTVVIGLTLKSLGYSLDSRDPGQLQEAVQVVAGQEPLMAGFLDPIAIRDGMISGDLWAAQLYSGDAAFAMAENEALAFFVPDEGSDFFVDNLVIPRDARNKEAAELFINYILRPDVHAAISNYTGYAIPNRAALEQGLIDDELLASEAAYPAIDTLEAWRPFDAEQLSLWNEAWSDIQREASATANR